MIGQQMPASEATLRGFSNTRAYAAASAERTGNAFRKGDPFKCVRGQGRVTLDECLKRFLEGREICARDCGCSLGKRAAEKMTPKTEEDMGYKDVYGDCACGKTGVQLDKHGRCYKCQESVREAAKEERKARVFAPAPVVPSEAAPSIPAAQGGHPAFDLHAKIDFPNGEVAKDWLAQKVGPRVEEIGEKLREGLRPLVNTFAALTMPDGIPPEGQLVGNEDPAPDACQGWPETAGTLVIDGISFEVVPSGKNTSTARPVVTFRAAAVAFSADAVRKHGLDKYNYIRMHKAPGVVCFELLTEKLPNTRKLHRQQKDAASLACTIHNIKDIFPGLSGKHFAMEATDRPGFFLARVG